MTQQLIYLDNAATSWPKPQAVSNAMLQFMQEVGANPGRSGHRMSIQAARVVYNAREAVAELFNAPDPLRVVFCLNVTAAINLALYGLLRPGDHVITSSMEHNAMMRPLRALEQRGIQLTIVECSPEGNLDPSFLEQAIQANTVLIALTHASNVNGALLPIRQAGQIARRHGILLLTDEAQTGGSYPVDMQANCTDLLAFTGHKSLYGPTGTGGLILGERVDPQRIQPIIQGGTGSRSEFEIQPTFLPDRYESGTNNAIGLAGLNAGLRWLMDRGVEAIRTHELSLLRMLIEGLSATPGLQVYGSSDPNCRTAVVSFNISGMQPSEAGLRLDEEYGILCRVGLHCAPAAHKTLGTFPVGAIRFGLGAFNTSTEVETALQAVASLAKKASE
jgi:cysteine desulfurase / selenocysteine lyase